jgi:hypothetical protein
MAFNPFTNFRKYQKIWMAVILLLCMITFVLCTGTRGDFTEYVLRLFRPSGQEYARIDNGRFTSSQAYDLKERRNLANDFMRKASKEVIRRIDEVMKPEVFKKAEQNPKELEQLQKVQRLRAILESNLRAPRYFDSGVKIDELVDFKLWLMEADRLNIDLSPAAVKDLTTYLLVQGFREFYPPEVYRTAYYEVRNVHNKVTEDILTQALRDEFRAQMVQQALGRQMIDSPHYTRISLTPAQMWDFYKEKRIEYRIALLPLHVEDFTSKVPAPNQEELEIFFNQNRGNPYDPTSDKISFAVPSRVKAAWVSADPNSDYFKKAAKLAVDLEATPVQFAPQFAGLQILACHVAKTAAAQQVFEGNVVKSRFRTSGPTQDWADWTIALWNTGKDAPAAAALIGAGARLDAGIAALPNLVSSGILRHEKEFQAGMREELKRRTPIYATVALMGNTQLGLAIPWLWNQLDIDFRLDYQLPLPVIQDQMLEIVERNQGRKWVSEHMHALKQRLDKIPNYARANVETILRKYANEVLTGSEKSTGKDHTIEEIGLQRGETKDFYDRFNVAEAKELEPLRKAFLANYVTINQLEGRELTPETRLKEGDFWKMFFADGGEAFSVTGNRYQAKPWPPDVKPATHIVQRVRMEPDPRLIQDPDLRLIAINVANAGPGQEVPHHLYDTAERPFLFWRVADEPPLQPEKLDDKVRDRVIAAWKLNKARESIVLRRVEEMAKAAEKSGNPNFELEKALKELQKEYGTKREIMPVGSFTQPVSPLVPITSSGGFGVQQRQYVDFDLDPGLITYPRKDTAANLLELYDLKKPIEIGYPPLDKLNKELFNEVNKDKKPQGKYVQVLTNQPHTAFYIAVTREQPFTSHGDFNMAVMEAGRHDLFFERAQRDAAKRQRDELVRQLRSAHDVVAPTEETRKHFDSDAGN